MGPYSVSKTAMMGLVKAMVYQLAKLNIRVNGLAPGVIETKFSEPVSTVGSHYNEILFDASWFKMNKTPCFYFIFTKGNIFYDFLFDFLDDKAPFSIGPILSLKVNPF